MRPRFVVAVAQEKSMLTAIRCRMREIDGQSAIGIVLEHARVDVFAVGRQVQSLGNAGVVIGPLYRRGEKSAVRLEPRDQEAVVRSRGEWLIRNCWGGYVAVIADDQERRVDLTRAPLGDLACYWSKLEGGVLFGSDLSLMRAAGMPPPALEAEALARYLSAEDLRRPDTCLFEIRELQGGDRITVSDGSLVTDALWSPWTSAAEERQIADPEEAARRVRDAALHCVGARAQDCSQIVLKLSGGLDSSIVGACLHAAQRPFTALTLVTHDPAGDERGHARLVAQALGVPLLERYRDPSQVDLERSAAAGLPRPTARAFTQETARIAVEAASETGSGAIFDGGGGDNLFCSLQSARPIADCLMSELGRGQFWRTAETIAQLAQSSIWTVVRRAWLMRFRRSADYPWDVDTRFLSADAQAQGGNAVAHPWLAAPKGALPGKAAHVALVAAAQSVAEGFDPEEALPTYSPLISQPLVEACLSVPSWLWFSRGRNRAVARHAFASRLPAATVERRSKGAPDCFIADLYESNRSKIRTLLMDGELRRHGLLDVPALAHTLDDNKPVRGHEFLRIMRLVDAEAWARRWT